VAGGGGAHREVGAWLGHVEMDAGVGDMAVADRRCRVARGAMVREGVDPARRRRRGLELGWHRGAQG